MVALTVHAKSLNAGRSGGHEADIYAVLPFERSREISELIYTIHQTIDYPVGYFDGLRDAPHEEFTWHKYGHRVFFHWGFNANPRSSQTLQSLVQERKWSESIEEAFWQKVIREQARRNGEVLTAIGSTLSLQTAGVQRSYINAFASIIVDIHILGDFSTTKRESLKTLDMIVSDLEKALFENFRGGDHAKAIAKKMNSTKSIADDNQRADAILKIMKSELPRFILEANGGFFARHFKHIGLKTKPLNVRV